MSPQSPNHCSWVQHPTQSETVDECIDKGTGLVASPEVVMQAQRLLAQGYGYTEKTPYFIFCQPEDSVQQFYKHYSPLDAFSITPEGEEA